MMLLRIDLVLSAILASSSQRLVNCSKVWASDRRRLSRCFSWAGETPSAMAFLASMQRSRAISSEIPSFVP
jgi:hypothetical protein